MEAIEAVVFDLDGTLIQSRHDYREMSRRVVEILRVEGVPEAELSQPGRVWHVIRSGAESLRELGLPPERRVPTHERITEALNSVELLALDSIAPIPGVFEALQLLEERGVKIGVATRSGGEYAKRSLGITGLAEYVDVSLARDEVEHPKPDPRHLLQIVEVLDVSPEDTIYIGDTTTDLATAKAAGIPFVGFISNEEWAERLKEAGCDAFISDLREIVEIVDRGSV